MSAERQRRRRARIKAGAIVCPVEITRHVIDALVTGGLLAEAERQDRGAIGRAIGALLRQVAGDA